MNARDNNTDILGVHLIIDLYDCDKEMLDNISVIRTILCEVIEEIGARIVCEGHKKFEPIGISAFFIISESHISIHTWPEYGYAAVDIFSCKKGIMTDISKLIKNKLKAGHLEEYMLQRGKI